MKAVKLKDGQIGFVIRELNWEENPQMKIYKDSTYKERLHRGRYAGVCRILYYVL
jgi:hypothetical protein